MADASPVVVVLAGPTAAEPLREVLGPERLDRLGALLVERAQAWAAAAFGTDAVRVVAGDVGAGDVGAGGVGAGDRDAGEGGGLGAVAREAFATARDQPVIVVAPVLPVWRPAIAAAALDDLRAGCAATVGPVFDGGFYLLAITRPIDALLGLPAAAWTGHDAMGRLIAAAHAAELQIGVLRTERGLRRPADVRSLLADPLTDGEVRGLLE